MGWPDDPERADRVAATVVGDGLPVRRGAAPCRCPDERGRQGSDEGISDGELGDQLVDGDVSHGPHLVVGAVLDGVGTNTRAGSKPSAWAWETAASTNTSEATKTAGHHWISSSTMSCTLHDVQLPQSASASITTLHSWEIWWRRSTGAGFVNVGLA